MKKIKIALVALMAGVLLSGCGGRAGGTSTFAPTQSSVYVSKDGSIMSAVVQTYDKSHYDEAKFQLSMEEWVSTYNQANGAIAAAKNTEGSGKLPVAVVSSSLAEGKATAVFEYASGEELYKFAENQHNTDNLVKLNLTVVKGGMKPMSGVTFVKPDGSSVKQDSVGKKGDFLLLSVEGTGVIQTEGKVLYMTEGSLRLDDFTVKTPEGQSYILFK